MDRAARRTSSSSRRAAASRAPTQAWSPSAPRQRGHDQLGTLGGGNHFVEVQRVDAIFDEAAARGSASSRGQLTVLIHTGSRGLGHQVCTDHVRIDGRGRWRATASPCPTASSPARRSRRRGGSEYFAAMCAAANFAWANRQVLTHRVREVFERFLPGKLAELVLRLRRRAQHREARAIRGARALRAPQRAPRARSGPRAPSCPPAYRGVGQPVFIPGSMGTSSFVLVGDRRVGEHLLQQHLPRRRPHHEPRRGEAPGGRATCFARSSSGRASSCAAPPNAELAEEAPLAYKDVERVVDVVRRAGIARKVARLLPLGVVKG